MGVCGWERWTEKHSHTRAFLTPCSPISQSFQSTYFRPSIHIYSKTIAKCLWVIEWIFQAKVFLIVYKNMLSKKQNKQNHTHTHTHTHTNTNTYTHTHTHTHTHTYTHTHTHTYIHTHTHTHTHKDMDVCIHPSQQQSSQMAHQPGFFGVSFLPEETTRERWVVKGVRR